ncbi:V-type proton ATPase subunit a [Caligus rogercresseyi]|uniref:V-type proton ATPase subunit a n=1 Tax=Caligus rogercresseyi TaxID=217165 RepID=A0A7T8K8L5_CALRO|nr:V-type proton ATPase subunit a [Caligus rogercresseyi]
MDLGGGPDGQHQQLIRDQLKSRVKKICEGFRATLYPCPDQSTDRREMAVGVMQRLEDLMAVLVRPTTIATESLWRQLRTSRVACPSTRDGEVGSTIAPVLNVMVTKEAPPTFFRTNKFTQGFQEMINSYGIATYQEANPAFWTVTTFPFLFAVMFGDAGHATIGLCVGLWIAEDRQRNVKIFFAGRYIITLMAMFSIYTGLIYNDFFSKSVNVFGSSWKPTSKEEDLLSLESDMINPAKGATREAPTPSAWTRFGKSPKTKSYSSTASK